MATEHFPDHETTCHCGCGSNFMDSVFMARLEELRVTYDKPMIVTSGFRCPAHNVEESTTGRSGPHCTGKAVDVKVSGKDSHKLVGIAFALGFTGVGISQRGPHKKRFIHLDTIEPGDGPRPWIWSY